MPDAGQRGAQVALDVDGERLHRRDVEDPAAALRLGGRRRRWRAGRATRGTPPASCPSRWGRRRGRCRPAPIAAQAPSCAAVGALNEPSNHARVAGENVVSAGPSSPGHLRRRHRQMRSAESAAGAMPRPQRQATSVSGSGSASGTARSSAPRPCPRARPGRQRGEAPATVVRTGVAARRPRSRPCPQCASRSRPLPVTGRGCRRAGLGSSTVPDEPLVLARGLVKRFGDFTAVDGIDVEVAARRGVRLPRAQRRRQVLDDAHDRLRLAGDRRHAAGARASIPRSTAPRIRARLGVVPQEDTLDVELTVRENLLVYGRYFGLSRAEVARAGRPAARLRAAHRARRRARSSRCRAA